MSADLQRVELPLATRLERPVGLHFHRLNFFPTDFRLWWDPELGRLWIEEVCNGPSTWSHFNLPNNGVRFYREKLKHLAALCGLASSKLCSPVSEKDIASAKECVEVGIEVMRQLLEEDKIAARLNGGTSI